MSKNLTVKPQKKQNSNSYTKEKFIELQNTRVIQKNLVHVIGISEKLCDNEVPFLIKFFSCSAKRNISDSMERLPKFVLILKKLMILITSTVLLSLPSLLFHPITKQLLQSHFLTTSLFTDMS